jgi:predicted transcriptional regulator
MGSFAMDQLNQPHLKPLVITLVQMSPVQLRSLSIDELAEASNYCRTTVKYKLKVLRKLGAIETKRAHDGPGGKYEFI